MHRTIQPSPVQSANKKCRTSDPGVIWWWLVIPQHQPASSSTPNRSDSRSPGSLHSTSQVSEAPPNCDFCPCLPTISAMLSSAGCSPRHSRSYPTEHFHSQAAHFSCRAPSSRSIVTLTLQVPDVPSLRFPCPLLPSYRRLETHASQQHPRVSCYYHQQWQHTTATNTPKAQASRRTVQFQVQQQFAVVTLRLCLSISL